MNEENVSQPNRTPLVVGVFVVILIIMAAGIALMFVKGKNTAVVTKNASPSAVVNTASPSAETGKVLNIAGYVTTVDKSGTITMAVNAPSTEKEATKTYTIKVAGNTPISLMSAPKAGGVLTPTQISIGEIIKGQLMNVVFINPQVTPPTTVTSDLIKEIQLINPVTPTPSPAK